MDSPFGCGRILCIHSTCASSQVGVGKTHSAWGSAGGCSVPRDDLLKEHSIPRRYPVTGRELRPQAGAGRASELQEASSEHRSGSKLFTKFHFLNIYFILLKCVILQVYKENDFNKPISTAYYVLAYFVLEASRTKIKFEVNYKTCVNVPSF